MLSCCFAVRAPEAVVEPAQMLHDIPSITYKGSLTQARTSLRTQTPPTNVQQSPKRSADTRPKCTFPNLEIRNCTSQQRHKFKCPTCDLAFEHISERYMHVKTEHAGGRADVAREMLLTDEQRKERRIQNQLNRKAERTKEKSRVAKFVHRPQVFVRVRPLNGEEQKESCVLPGLKTKTELAKELGPDEKVPMLEEGLLTGFEGVLGVESSNTEVYNATLADKIPMILRGGQVSMFCYGHTGTGKTHTSMGYSSHPGLFKLACEDILKSLNEASAGLPPKEKLFIQVRFTEVHVGKVYDLLEDPKAECLTLEDDDGAFRIRRQPAKNDKGWFISGDQKFVVVEDLANLLQILEKGIETRACGSSSVHDQSSRSHAMMEMEVVTTELRELRHRIMELDAEHSWGKNQCDQKNPDWPRKRVAQLKSALGKARAQEKALLKNSGGAMGGTLTLADLAGADYDHRTYTESGNTKQEQRESAEINKELFCLKECMRTSIAHKPWRESVLSKILKRVLEPPSGRETQAIMVATVSPAETKERFTLNTLRYAQKVSGYEDDKTKSAKAMRARDMKRQIRAVYREYCTDKSPEEVEAIIAKWDGKLNRLLAGVWKKYTSKEAKSKAAKAKPIAAATKSNVVAA